jgi:hypothetical protein
LKPAKIDTTATPVTSARDDFAATLPATVHATTDATATVLDGLQSILKILFRPELIFGIFSSTTSFKLNKRCIRQLWTQFFDFSRIKMA